MSPKERQRKAIFESVKQGHLKLREVALKLKISYRQAKRIWGRYNQQGDEGLVHQNRGKRSNRRYKEEGRQEIIKYYQEKLDGFGPTLAREKLQEEGYQIDHETLRRWLIFEGLWEKRRKRTIYRSRRERRHRFGELVQMDGSFHDWFGDGKQSCLMNMVDDATTTTYSELSEEETTLAAMTVLQGWIKKYGIPLSLYTDKKNVYVVNRESTLEEEVRGEEPLSVFGKACQKLGIEIIKANSPQAKGRVERNHGVYQDRFTKELRLKGVKTFEGANELLKNGFIRGLNQKFSREAICKEDAHRPLSEDINLYEIFSWEEQRQLNNDWTLSYYGRYFQIEKEFGEAIRPRSKILVRKHLDGKLSFHHQGKAITWHEIEKRPEKKQETKVELTNRERREVGREGAKKSSWRNKSFLFGKALKETRLGTPS